MAWEGLFQEGWPVLQQSQLMAARTTTTGATGCAGAGGMGRTLPLP